MSPPPATEEDDAEAAAGARRTPSAHWPWWLALALLTLPGYGLLLVGDEGAIGRDYGMLFLDVLVQQRAALLDGSLLLWDGSQVGGTAFWPLPNQAPLYPPLMLCLLARGAIEGLNLCLFLHVLWGALGVYALVFTLGRRQLAALVGGVLFANAYFLRHLVDILPLEALALTWIPWAFCCLARALTATRWLRWAVAGGIAYAAVPWLGGFIQFLPGLVVAGTIVLVASLRRPLPRHLARGAAILPAFTATMALVSAGKLLPMWHWIALTDRAGGITVEFALGGSLLPEEMWQWSLNEGWTPWLLLVCGLLLGARRRANWSLPFAAAVAVLLLIASGPLYRVLYEYAPGFSYVREPRRVWLLMPSVLPVAAGLGLALLQDRLRLPPRLALAAGGAVLALVCADLIGWSRYKQPRLQSLSARLEANAIHRDLARRAQQEPRFRVIDFAKVRARTKQTADLMRSCFGLQGLEGILGNVAIQAYDVDFLNVARDARAKLLGLMNCRYVTSADPVEQPGLTLVREFPPDTERPFRGIDGPFLYRNELALPRAGLSDHALLQVGGDASHQEQLLLSGSWDPRRATLVRAEAATLLQCEPELLRRFDGAVLCGKVEPELLERLRDAGLQCLVLARDRAEDLDPWLERVLPEASAQVQALPDPPAEWNTVGLQLPEGAGGRWLVLSETCAIYPGWCAEVDGAPAPLFVANAVTTAIPLPAGARSVRLRYAPPGLGTGLALTGTGLLLAGIVFFRRPKGPPPHAAPTPRAS